MATTTVHRAENVGSLLRPQWLKDAREQLAAGALPLPEFKRIEDRAVDEAVQLYEEIGLDVVTDGEQRRSFFFSTLTEIVDGLGFANKTPPPAMSWHGADEYRSADDTFSLPVAVTERMQRVRSLATEEFVYARARTQAPLKVTLPSPLCLVALWSAEYSRDAYPDPMGVVEDAVKVLAAEVRELVSVGCTDVQIDAPEIGSLVDPAMRAWYAEAVGIDPDRMLTEGIDLVNELAKTELQRQVRNPRLSRQQRRPLPRERGLRGCFARRRSRGWTPTTTSCSSMTTIAQAASSRCATSRADAVVVLGLVSTKNPVLESDEVVRARIEEAARFFPRDQLALSTQCGFASTSEGNPLSEAEQADKLRLVARVAHYCWS